FPLPRVLGLLQTAQTPRKKDPALKQKQRLPPAQKLFPSYRVLLVKIEFGKGEILRAFGKLQNLCLHRSCGKFLRLFQGFVLAFTKAVGLAPGNGMCRQQNFQVSRIDTQQIAAALYSCYCTRIAVGHSEASAFVIHKAVKGYLSFRAEVESYSLYFRNHAQLCSTYSFVELLGHTIHCAAVNFVLFFTQLERLPL